MVRMRVTLGGRSQSLCAILQNPQQFQLAGAAGLTDKNVRIDRMSKLVYIYCVQVMPYAQYFNVQC